MRTWTMRHPVLTYFALAFAISWGGVLCVLRSRAILDWATPPDPLPPIAGLAMVAGPCVAGLLSTGLVRGTLGLRSCLASATKWRVPLRWYAVALLPAPLLAVTVFAGSSVVSPGSLPGVLTTNDRPAPLFFSVGMGLIAGVLEELGWTGFAVPALRPQYSVVATGLAVGVPWGAWHLMLVVPSMNQPSASLPLLLVLFALFVCLPVFRVMMVWVYESSASLLLAILMHASLTATALTLMSPGAVAPF